MKTFFTSDLHLGDSRITQKISTEGRENLNILLRPFNSIQEMNLALLKNFDAMEDGDNLIVIGDFINKDVIFETVKNDLLLIKRKLPNSKFILIKGNHETDEIGMSKEDLEWLDNYFFTHIVEDSLIFTAESGEQYFCSHYPEVCVEYIKSNPEAKCLTGHVHGMWRMQQKIINVGVDVWNYKFVSLPTLKWAFSTIENYYMDDKENNFPDC